MTRFLTALALALALTACDNSGSGKQGPKTQRQDTPAATAEAQCTQLQGEARDACERQAREGGTATPSIAATADKPTADPSGAAPPARAERGSGVEGATSAGTTTSSQQPLSTGATTR